MLMSPAMNGPMEVGETGSLTSVARYGAVVALLPRIWKYTCSPNPKPYHWMNRGGLVVASAVWNITVDVGRITPLAWASPTRKPECPGVVEVITSRFR